MPDQPTPSVLPITFPASAVHVTCDPSTPAGDALVTILSELGGRALRHRRRVLDSPDPEALHDLRVAVRRSRSALSDVRRVLVGDPRRRLRDGLKQIGRWTGPLRDLDVLAESIGQVAVEPRGLDAALEEVARRAAREREKVLGRIERPAVERFLRGLRHPAAPAGRAAAEPVARVAERTIDRVWRRFHAAGERAAASGSDADLHRLRIRGKRLRYALEFFGTLLADTSAEVPDVGVLRRFQDALGHHNDLASQVPLLVDLAGSAETDRVRELFEAEVATRRIQLAESRRAIVDGWRAAGALGVSDA